jgi:hypothetical protein
LVFTSPHKGECCSRILSRLRESGTNVIILSEGFPPEIIEKEVVYLGENASMALLKTSRHYLFGIPQNNV